MALRTISEVFDFAIAAEIEAARTYRDLASRAKRHDLRRLLLSIADEEDAHQKSLEQIREGDLSLFAVKLPEIELSAPLAAIGLDPEMTQAQLLLAAIDAERQACQLYTELAVATDDLGLSTCCGRWLSTLAEVRAGVRRGGGGQPLGLSACRRVLNLDLLKVTIGVRVYPGTDLARAARNERVITADDDLLRPRFYMTPDLEPWIRDELLSRGLGAGD